MVHQLAAARPPRTRRTLLALLASLAVLATACGSGGETATTRAEPVGGPSTAPTTSPTTGGVGDPAAGSVLPSLDVVDVRTGATVSLASFDQPGTPRLLWFWAPHCTTCRRLAPTIDSFATGNEGEVVVLGLGAKDDLDLGRDFIEVTDVGFPMLWDDEGAMWRAYGVVAQPAAVLLDGDGQQVGRWQGVVAEDELQGALDRLR